MMERPTMPPDRDSLDAWRQYALDFLRMHFREFAPVALGEPRYFPRSPLDGEGAAVIFSFASDRGNAGRQDYWVVVGQTEPNYYPGFELEPEEAYCLHLGTRFMLVMGVAQVPEEFLRGGGGTWRSEAAQNLAAATGEVAGLPAAGREYDAVRDAREIVNRVAPDRTVTGVSVAATFDVGGQLHTVLRFNIDDQPVFAFGRDAPAGFSTRVDLAPQVAYRIHLGRVLLAEPDPAGPIRAD